MCATVWRIGRPGTRGGATAFASSGASPTWTRADSIHVAARGCLRRAPERGPVRRAPQPFAQVGVASQVAEGLGESFHVVWLDDEAVHSVVDEVGRGARLRRRDDRQP